MECEFTLLFSITNCSETVGEIVELLGAAGLTDATLGIGRPGYISMDFIRVAQSTEMATRAAVAEVGAVLPRAIFIEQTSSASADSGANNFGR